MDEIKLATGATWQEIGSPGLDEYAGMIRQAYAQELYWPSVAPLYNRIWRSDPEASLARVILEAMASRLTLEYKLPPEVEKPSSADLAAVDFGNQMLSDIEGGISNWFVACMSRVPFYGWGWWEVVPGLRRAGWQAPNNDPWRSNFDDGRVGIRRLAFRHYASFFAWQIDPANGRLTGMQQNDPPHPIITIPLERSLHITFGDRDNPEGLATMEAMWRLERIKYNLEIIQGIGFEHAAGHAKFTSSQNLTDDDKAIIRQAARAVMSAQEGNYMALPENIQGEIIDVPFQAAESLQNAIRYYGILKMALLGMQWAALGTLSPYGSYSSMKDANEFFLAIFNSMAGGFVAQFDQQVSRRLYGHPANAASLGKLSARPVLTVSRAQKIVDLDQLGSFMTAFSAVAQMGTDDIIAIRRKSDFLPDTLPDDDLRSRAEAEPQAEPEAAPEPQPGDNRIDPEDSEEDDMAPGDTAKMARRTVGVGADEQPVITQGEATVGVEDVNRAVRKFERWAEENEPELAGLLRAKAVEVEDGNES